jgi:hypothetical protein
MTGISESVIRLAGKEDQRDEIAHIGARVAGTNFEAIGSGQYILDKTQIDLAAVEMGDRFAAVAGQDEFEILAFQGARQRAPEQRAVRRDQDSGFFHDISPLESLEYREREP